MTQARERLTETARSHAILIDAIVGHELALGEPVEAAQRNAVIQIGLAYAAGGGASAVGDLNLARREERRSSSSSAAISRWAGRCTPPSMRPRSSPCAGR